MNTKPPKVSRTRRVTLEIGLGRYCVFAKANKILECWTDDAPGTEALILRSIEGVSSAQGYAELYCFNELGMTIEEIDALIRGEQWCWEI